jgi:UDP-3-O-[3-hydroxymyristoyl] glucosamine N-acyltransferase
MVDESFYNISRPLSLRYIAESIKCDIAPKSHFCQDLFISSIRSLDQARSGDISFLSNKKYLNQLKETKASACIVDYNVSNDLEAKLVLLRTKNPYLAYAKLIDLFYKAKKSYQPLIMKSAYIASSAVVGSNSYIGHNVVIEENAKIGDDCIIEAGSFIDCGVIIGDRAKIYSNVSISYSIIGDDVVILPGARIGQDGFGFATEAGIHHKIFHTGRVIIGNNVEIGANTTIDRGSLNDTIIGDLCRIDNLVQIAHNVEIGKGSIIVAQVGISGSSKIGNYCALGGQVGVAGHIVIGDKTQVAAGSGVIQNIAQEAIVGGTPTVPIRDWHRQAIIMKQLVNKKNNSEKN